jgi:hypothetical protein
MCFGNCYFDTDKPPLLYSANQQSWFAIYKIVSLNVQRCNFYLKYSDLRLELLNEAIKTTKPNMIVWLPVPPITKTEAEQMVISIKRMVPQETEYLLTDGSYSVTALRKIWIRDAYLEFYYNYFTCETKNIYIQVSK